MYRSTSSQEDNLITIQAGENSANFRFLTDGPFLDNPDAAFPLGLLGAMHSGQTLKLDRPVSERLLERAHSIQEIYTTWWPDQFQMVAVEADIRQPFELPKKRKTGVFFSGGVDACATLLRHMDRIDSLLHVRTVDGDEVEENWLIRRAHLQAIADAYGKELLVIEPEPAVKYIKRAFPRYLGAFQTTLGHALAGQFHRFYIPTAMSYQDIHPGSSHPITDPLWSSEEVEFIHDGCGQVRIHKVAAISEHPDLVGHLQVCWFRSDLNCGRCEKCVRTMTGLRACGVWDRYSHLFAVPLDLKKIRWSVIDKELSRVFVHETLQFVEEKGTDPELIKYFRDEAKKKYNRGIWRLARLIVRQIRKIRTGDDRKKIQPL